MRTAVRLLTRMQTHMSLEVVALCKPFVTDFTLKRLFTCVSTLVILKYILAMKATITVCTAVWLLASL